MTKIATIGMDGPRKDHSLKDQLLLLSVVLDVLDLTLETVILRELLKPF